MKTHFENLHILNHSLIRHKISLLRKIETQTGEFRRLVHEITSLIGYEATSDLPLMTSEIETPLEKTEGHFLSKPVCIVPILRAGLGMTDAILSLIPTARTGHIGLFRDPKTFNPVEYYCKLPPDLSESVVLLLDPMLATGGSASAAVDFLKKHGAKKIKMLNIIGSPQGVDFFCSKHTDVDVYLGTLDRGLNPQAYILPGLGDAGDRIFGTDGEEVCG